MTNTWTINRWLCAPSATKAVYFRHLGNTGGFTMIDNLITLAIMMFTMMALIGLLGAVISANSSNKNRTTAITLAENKIAEVRRKGYDATIVVDGTVIENYNSIPGYPTFKRETFTDVAAPMAVMQTVRVTVRWNSDQKSISRSTQVAQ
jgi:Tfp pilus assembly protein PilV